MPPGGSPAHVNEMCKRLEHLKTGEVTSLAKPFHDLAEMIKRRGLIIVISDLYDDENEVIKALRHFRHKKHGVILFHIFDAAELEFPFTKLTQFLDLETNEKYQVDPKAVREAYLTELRAFIDRYKKACSDSDTEYVLTDTSVPYGFLLRSYLARRQRMK
jgi:ribosomal protein L36